jgi:hypothetical protein
MSVERAIATLVVGTVAAMDPVHQQAAAVAAQLIFVATYSM